MDLNVAKAKLDHVIRRGRVEMYKPIQVAEVLYAARTVGGIDLAKLESYRTKSKHWRDEVTFNLFGKKSTSTAKFQDDVWNETAVPPAAMVALGAANASSGVVEAYIYSSIIRKNEDVTVARSAIEKIRSVGEVEQLLAVFESASLKSSADRLYEILATAIFKTELSQTAYTISVDRPQNSARASTVDGLVDLVASAPMPLVVDRLGHTNAADAGLDIWTNFGVAINVKRRPLTSQLLDQIISDTPIGSLHIVCLDIEPAATTRLKQLQANGLRISITTRNDLMKSVQTLLADPSSPTTFVNTLVETFDKEFPMAGTLGDFAASRGYSTNMLTGIWKRTDNGA
jgi:type II restriction enzyme